MVFQGSHVTHPSLPELRTCLYYNLRIKTEMKLLRVVKSIRPGKKLDAVFETDTGREKRVSFGQAGAPDFTLTGDEERKRLYLIRHKARENWNDPVTPGALSRWILWNKPTIEASVRDFRSRFKI